MCSEDCILIPTVLQIFWLNNSQATKVDEPLSVLAVDEDKTIYNNPTYILQHKLFN